ncbi:hypothetical protein [uncultured Ruegeria sp.]|uniref:hypothetical protein n=1 Tax=uncultured Ruegeria sp. TaxID=259304 RepID=UPI00260A6124|nr:hypothetical protein [uncultured Ruegeria sp.]
MAEEERRFAIEVSAGTETDELISYIFNEMTDDEADAVDVERVSDHSGDIAFEPVSATAIFAVTSATAFLVLRLIEQWVEGRRQDKQIEALVRASQTGVSDDVVKALTELSKKHADISVSRGSISAPTLGKLLGQDER